MSIKMPLGNAFSSEFGVGSAVARLAVAALYDALAKGGTSGPQNDLVRWRNHVGRVYGTPLISSEAATALRKQYVVDAYDSANPESILYSVHSYLSLCMKLLAVRILDIDTADDSILRRIVHAVNTQQVWAEYAQIESGAYFRDRGFSNYLDSDFYGWLGISDSPAVAESIQRISTNLLSYSDLSSLLPNNTIDIIGHLYQSIIPKVVRHKLGEYYTPDWLARHVLDMLQYREKSTLKLLDPACGSGIFLLVALETNLKALAGISKTTISANELTSLLENIAGHDVNPLAIQAARTNILCLLSRFGIAPETAEIPVYLGDALSPLRIAPVDIVVGNPPWIFWNALPSDYRETLRPLFCDRYELMARRASTMKRLGSAGKDISMLFFYTAIDKYLKSGGHIGFIVPQSLFQSTAADEFRRFTLPDGNDVGVTGVDDFAGLTIFGNGTTNKTAVLYAVKGSATKYPVPYNRCIIRPNKEGHVGDAPSILPVERLYAQPYDSKRINSFWVLSKNQRRMRSSIVDGLRPRLGIETKLESVFRVTILSQKRGKKIVIENDRRRAKIAVPQMRLEIEPDLVSPYVSGASLRRWGYDIAGYYVIPHTAATGQTAIDQDTMANTYPLTLEYFHRFRSQLESRSIHLRWGKRQPFYALYGIGSYTFAPYRVAWKRTTRDFSAAVISTTIDPLLGVKTLVANGKVMILPFEDKNEAHYFCGVLNAPEFRWRINNAITSEAHSEIIRAVPLRPYNRENDRHREIAALSERLHESADKADSSSESISVIEQALNDIILREWSL